MNKRLGIGIGALVAVAVAAWLAFGFFGIQTLFSDDEVSEANPFANTINADMADNFDDMEDAIDSGEVAVEPAVETTTSQAAMPDMPDSDMAGETSAAEAPAAEEPAAEEPAEPQIVTVASGSLVDHAHVGDGTINVITDGQRRFLRFEDDFAIDNGPDLNVYLVRGVDAGGPASEFDGDFIDLGDLKGNIGAQNYELAADVDIDEYDTVVIWCVRFGVAFNAADLQA